MTIRSNMRKPTPAEAEALARDFPEFVQTTQPGNQNMDPKRILYIHKNDMSLGACIRAAVSEGRRRAGGAVRFRVVYEYGPERRAVGVEIVPA